MNTLRRIAALGLLGYASVTAQIADDGLRQAFERTIYSLKDSGHGRWRGNNRVQRLGLEFDAGAVRLRHPLGGISVRLTGFGHGARLGKPAPGHLTATGNRLEYRRGDLTEWYVNGSQGLEQGFTFKHRPAGGGRTEPLTISLGVSGDLAPTQHDGVVLLTSGEGVVLRYGGLTARDAGGRTLPSRLEVRGREIRLLVDDRAAQYPVLVDPTWSQAAELLASDGLGSDQFGYSVAVSGGTAVIGAYGHSIGGLENVGTAYVFVQSGATWSQQAELTASDGAEDDNFGISVAVSGGTAVIGANQHQVGSNTSQGAAYVFVQSGSTWTQQQELTASDGSSIDNFGYSVAVSGGTAVVGAYQHQVGSNGAQGAAYVFVQSGSTWTQQQELTASDGSTGAYFGTSVSVDGGTAVVGAEDSCHDAMSNNQGTVYVFVQSGSTWSQQAELKASDGGSGDGFGCAVAVSGGTALIGAHEQNNQQGTAYVFVRSGSMWSQQQELTASDGAGSDQFGYSVAVSGGTAAIGANLHRVASNPFQGSAYVFTQSGSTWTQQQELTASDGKAYDGFGGSVTLSGNTVLVGAQQGYSTGQGSAYSFAPPASLSISATHSSPIFQAGPGTITLTVANAGGPTAAAATVSDVIDAGFTVNSASSGCVVSGHAVTCTLASGASAASTVFNVYVTASASAPASISNSATLTDGADTITAASSMDTIAVGAEMLLMDTSLTQLVLNGTTDNGACASGNMTLTATDQLQNISGATLTNPYAVIGTLSQGNMLMSQSADSASVAAGANVTFTFHIRLASCNTFQLFFDVRSGGGPG